jgi:hypothetical protein
MILSFANPIRPIPALVYRGLGLKMVFRASPKGRRPPMWTVYHLGTGHVVCNFNLHEGPALVLATEIAECGNWDFDGLQGWRNVDPDLPDKFRAIRAAHSEAKFLNSSGHQSEEVARAIAETRA